MRHATGLISAAVGGLVLMSVGCNGHNGHDSTSAAKKPVIVAIKPDATQEQVQEALIKAKPGEVVEFPAGKFSFKSQLSIGVSGITVRGQGPDKTILSFKEQNAGAEGIFAKDVDKLVFENFAVEDSKGDAIKVTNIKGVVFRNVRTEWTGPANEKNGAYGLYPVQCTDVLVEGCVAIGASDAGIYVGQSKNIIVRDSKAERNVAGIEIENCFDADVYHCEATDNAGGLLVFDLPNLQQKNGARVRVFQNKVYKNNHANFAPKGNTVANVPPGTGVMVMATDQVEVFDNDISDNQTCNLSLIAFNAMEKEAKDKEYDPYSEGVFVHDNRFSGGGEKPSGRIGMMMLPVIGPKFPDIVYDGLINPKKAVNGKLPSDLALIVRDNGDADFINIKLGQIAEVLTKKVQPDRDLKNYGGARDPLPPVKIAGVN